MALLAYLITDPKVLGILAWGSMAITVLGFAIAIWQILKVRRAADAARDASLGLAHRVRSRELLAKLGDAHTHLEAARNHVERGERTILVLCLELSHGSIIEAQEISRSLALGSDELQILSVLLRQLAEQASTMPDLSLENDDLVRLRLQLRDASEILLRRMAQSRYSYDVGEE